MGLTTLPMPQEASPGTIDFNFAGTRIGNKASCNAQGFFFIFGVTCMFLYNYSLCIYYALAIAFKVKERKIKKYAEPFFHVVPLAYSLTCAIYPIFVNAYNPTGYEAWCTVYGGNLDSLSRSYLEFSVLVFTTFVLASVLLCFTLIIWRVEKTERALSSLPVLTNGQRMDQKILSSHQNTKVVLVQSSAYMIAYICTLLWPVLHFFTGGRTILRLQIIFLPLQGFFNFLIFVSHKIHKHREARPEISRLKIFLSLFKKYDEPILLSRISLIHHDEIDNRMNILLEDEREIQDLSFNVSGSGLEVHIHDGDTRDELNEFSQKSFQDCVVSNELSSNILLSADESDSVLTSVI